MKKRLVLGLFVLAGFLAGIFLFYRWQQGTAVFSGATKLPPWRVQEVPVWTLVRGQEFIYDLNYSGPAVFGSSSKANSQYQVQGNLVLTVLGEEGDQYRVWLRLRSEKAEGLASLPVEVRQSL